ncbi:hypothetical protein B0T10DRAFT_608312 [Thelonectria olida]|uniref:Uncharacterized protein n=1 Tax=Thelonectria olida TaxID=1576542 RepID=A0A9P8W282_9HYPO|nr:hypothetical protein B0T10DRAFT_608312 [Thelonectria olida]
MIDRTQCQTHTRNPWGKPNHRYDYRIRYAAMGTLCFTILAVAIAGTVIAVEKSRHDLDALGDILVHLAAATETAHGCEAYFKPDICCPLLTVCFETKWSPSGIYCCADKDACIASEKHPPQCVAHTTQCGRGLGGGCCPEGTICSPDGCLRKVTHPSKFKDAGREGTRIEEHWIPKNTSIVNKTVREGTSTTKASQKFETGVKFGEVGLAKSGGCRQVRWSTLQIVVMLVMTVQLLVLCS